MTIDAHLAPRARWFQSEFILSAARRLYLAIAVLSFVAALGAVVVAASFQLGIWTPVSEKSLPDLYQADENSLDVSVVDAHFAPPANVRFVVTAGAISSALNGQEILGYFDADTANGLARYPNDFDILGGRDADQFQRALASGEAARTGLQPSAALVSKINGWLQTAKTPASHTFQIQVIARDAFNHLSSPANISFDLVVGPVTPGQPASESVSPMQSLAHDIALAIDPQRTTAYFDAYRRALNVPAQCGADGNDVVFVGNFRRAFEHVRDKLNGRNVEQLYTGVCDGWSKVLNRIAESQTARAQTQASNFALKMAAEVAKDAARLARNTSLLFAFGAFLFFMMISLSLAFLSIENHTRAMRESLQSQSRPDR